MKGRTKGNGKPAVRIHAEKLLCHLPPTLAWAPGTGSFSLWCTSVLSSLLLIFSQVYFSFTLIFIITYCPFIHFFPLKCMPCLRKALFLLFVMVNNIKFTSLAILMYSSVACSTVIHSILQTIAKFQFYSFSIFSNQNSAPIKCQFLLCPLPLPNNLNLIF